MALLGGADLVLELPVLWSTASAEYFAAAGVSLLRSTGVVTTLGYSAETTDTNLPSRICGVLVDPPETYHNSISALQKEGLSFPTARAAALCGLLPGCSEDELTDFLSRPNNILALEYEKALAAPKNNGSVPMKGYALRRIGDDYHQTQPGSRYASATAVRSMLFSGSDIADYVPASSLSAIAEYQKEKPLISEQELSLLLKYRLLTLQKEGFSSFADCSPDLSCKIVKQLGRYQDFTQFVSLLKSRDLTWTRISRVLLHILLDLTKEDYLTYQGSSMTPYLRVLGFRRESAPLLSAIKKEALCPLITKAADASHVLSPKAYALLEKDFFASELYQSLLTDRTGRLSRNEFTRELVIV
jgi:predicted nucleotidyltransferase